MADEDEVEDDVAEDDSEAGADSTHETRGYWILHDILASPPKKPSSN